MLSVNNGLYGVFFNKQIIKDMGLEDLYSIVREGRWTIEKYYSLAKNISRDLNGDGKMDYDDHFGLVSESYNAYTFVIASGVKIASKDDGDFPALSLNTPRAIKALELSAEFLKDKNTTLLADDYGPTEWARVWGVFSDGRALFSEGSLMQTPDMRSMEIDFGILPNPKLDESQDRYYHTLSVWNAPLMVVPETVANPDKVGYILEILAAKSVDTLTPAYYDLQLTHKLLRDDESEEMLDIILSSAAFDLGAAYNFGGLFDMILSVGARDAGSGNFASLYEKAESRAQKAIDKLIEAINT
jgi:hypothetical protein